MKRRLLAWSLVLCLLPAGLAAERTQEGLREWLRQVDAGLAQVVKEARAGNAAAARSQALRVYLDQYEVIEGWYGPGGRHAVASVADAITRAEFSFHVLIKAESARELEQTAAALRAELLSLERLAVDAQVQMYPDLNQPMNSQGRNEQNSRTIQTPEIRKIVALLDHADAALQAGRRAEALQRVEEAYLEGFEPLESRLPGPVVGSVERAIHLQLRPALKGNIAASNIAPAFADLRNRLAEADELLAKGNSFWFGALNSFVIIVREGLEAVLLVAALLAYLSASHARRQERVRIWAGAGAGIAASLGTWVVASTVIPLGGASRELVEGVTALLAVVVLLYVSHWLFQKTYIHDWKAYLRDHLGSAMTRGSALAMMGLAFAAVYREGFETVLFYQALLMDAGGRSVLTGFLPGVLVIAAIGWAIIRAGMKLPLKQVFAVSNTILLYLAFVFLGKGIYNLQESGAFSTHPIAWLPAHPALQQLLGFYPLAETILAQAALAALLALALVVYRRRMVRARAVATARAEVLAA